jgi:hypothetical protein
MVPGMTPVSEKVLSPWPCDLKGEEALVTEHLSHAWQVLASCSHSGRQGGAQVCVAPKSNRLRWGW